MYFDNIHQSFFLLFVYLDIRVHAGVCRDQQVSEALVLELQKVLRHLVWLLRTEPRSSTRAASHLNC